MISQNYLRRLIISSVIILAFSTTVMGQYWTVKGAILDSAQQEPLLSATVVLMNLSDSSKRAVATNEQGQFRITNVLNNQYLLTVSYVGFNTYQKLITVQDATVKLGDIFLGENIKELNEVVVEEKIPRVTQKGDTVEMNAVAYKVNPDANAEDLLEKMPGVVIQNGQVQAQGENVRRVLVDGREFFGEDPNAALKNLPAEVIDKIQVYDQESDQAQFTGFRDGETSKTLNIITKASMRNGTFGKVYAGTGSDETYNAGGNINLFREKSRTTIIGQTNNINIQNFATSDLLGIVGGGGRRSFRARGSRGGGFSGGSRFSNGGNVSDFLVSQQGGISETQAFGINYSLQANKKFNITGSYFYNSTDNRSDASVFRQFTLPENEGQTYEETSFAPSNNTNHRLSMRIDYTIDEKNSIQVRPQLTYQKNEGSSTVMGLTANEGQSLNTTHTLNRSDLLAYNLSNNLLWRHRFEKRGRTFSVNLSTSYNENNGESFLQSQNEFFGEGGRNNEDLDQFADLENPGWTVTANATYTEPVTDKSQLSFTYRVSKQHNDSDKQTFDFDEGSGGYSDLNVPLTNTFESNYTTHRTGVGYNLRGEKANFTLRANYQWATLDNEQVFPFEDDIKRDFQNILPSIVYRYRFSRSKNLSVTYRTNTTAPTVSQLQQVIDNSNPLFISMGNPELDQNYQHTAMVRFMSTDAERSTSFFAMMRASFSDNYIGNSTTIASRDNASVNGVELQPGAQLSQPVNLSGYWNIRSFMSYGLPLGLIKSNLNFTASATYSRTPEMINGVLNHAEAPNFGIGVVLSSNISEKIDFTLSSNSSYSIVNNSVQGQNDTYFNQGTKLRFNWIFGDGLVFRSTVNHTLNSGLSEGFDQNYMLWNMEVGKKLFKQKGELKLTVFDLLKENQSISRSVTGSYIEDAQSQILTQYLMLTFTFNIRSFGLEKAPSVNDEMRRRMQQFRQGGGFNKGD